MAKPFDPRKVLKQIANSLLREFFTRRGELADVPWDQLSEHRIEPVFDAWQSLPEHQKLAVQVILRDISELSDHRGMAVLAEEILWRKPEVADQFKTQASKQDKAMWVYLNIPEAFSEVALFARADARGGPPLETPQQPPQRGNRRDGHHAPGPRRCRDVLLRPGADAAGAVSCTTAARAARSTSSRTLTTTPTSISSSTARATSRSSGRIGMPSRTFSSSTQTTAPGGVRAGWQKGLGTTAVPSQGSAQAVLSHRRTRCGRRSCSITCWLRTLRCCWRRLTVCRGGRSRGMRIVPRFQRLHRD